MTTANLEYTPDNYRYMYVKGDCDISFYGKDIKKHEDACHDIKYKKCREVEQQVKTIESKKIKIQTKLDENLSHVKHKWKIFRSDVEQNHFKESKKLQKEIHYLNTKIEILLRVKYKEPSCLRDLYDSYLKDDGFLITSTSTDTSIRTTKSTIYTKQ